MKYFNSEIFQAVLILLQITLTAWVSNPRGLDNTFVGTLMLLLLVVHVVIIVSCVIHFSNTDNRTHKTNTIS